MPEIAKYLRKYRKYLIWGPFFKLLEALFELFLPLLMAQMIQKGLFALPGQAWSERDVLHFGFLLLLVIVSGFGFSFTCQWMASKCSQGLGTDLREAVFAKVHRLSSDQLRAVGQARLRGVQSTDMQAVQLAIAFVIRLLIRAPFVCIGAIIMSFYIQPTLAWALFMVVPIFSFVLYFNLFRAVDLLRAIQVRKDLLLQKITDIFGGMRVIRAYLGEEKEAEDFAKVNEDVQKRSNAYETRLQDVNVWLILLLYGAQIGILAFADRFLGTNLLSRADLIALLSYVNQVLIAMKVIANLAIVFPNGWASAQRIETVLNIPEEVERSTWAMPNKQMPNKQMPIQEECQYEAPLDPVEAKSTIAKTSSVVTPKSLTTMASPVIETRQTGLLVTDLTYAYPNSRLPAVSNLSFVLPKGKTLGIIGGTGSGKTTLCRLLAGQLKATEGHIFWQGVNREGQDLIAIVGFAPQEAVLFTGSLAENLLPPTKDIPASCMQLALATAQATSFIDWTKDAERMIQQFGNNFSGGQRQRLTIARALLRQPELLILDDVQSGLDFYTAHQMRLALRQNYPDLTTIIATQRIEQVMQADWILVMEDGKITAQGQSADLLQTSSTYQQLYAIQFGGGSDVL